MGFAKRSIAETHDGHVTSLAQAHRRGDPARVARITPPSLSARIPDCVRLCRSLPVGIHLRADKS